MYLKTTLVSAIVLASLTNAADTKPSTPSDLIVESAASTIPISEEMVIPAGTDFFIPNFMLDEDIELTPEESQMRRINLKKVLSRLSKASGVEKGKLNPRKVKKVGKLATGMSPETGDHDTSNSVSPAVGSAENSNIDYSVDGEGDTDLDASPEETELRRGGRGGRGRGRGGRGGRGRGRGGRGRGRGRFGRGRGRFGRGRFGRGGRFGRFGGRGFGRFGRFGRFGYGGYGWNDDCGGDDCGSC